MSEHDMEDVDIPAPAIVVITEPTTPKLAGVEALAEWRRRVGYFRLRGESDRDAQLLVRQLQPSLAEAVDRLHREQAAALPAATPAQEEHTGTQPVRNGRRGSRAPKRASVAAIAGGAA
jgi:hypothetical protein